MADKPSAPQAGIRRWIGHVTSGWLSSAAVHVLILIALALIVPLVLQDRPVSVLHVSLEKFEDGPPLESSPVVSPHPSTQHPSDQADVLNHLQTPDIGEPSPGQNQQAAAQSRPLGHAADIPSDPMLRVAASSHGGLDGRKADNRSRLALTGGGSPESEAAVERGLAWLAAHQRRDGSWRFDHHQSSCQGQCRDPGTEASTTASTAVALLPFFGAGYTQFRGDYQYVVQNGLDYLRRRIVTSPHGADLQEGTMYAQGLATIALCEAYGMTQDKELKEAAQRAVDFIVFAQNKPGGGWRYTPGAPGDTTVTGWQLMALKSAQMAYLKVPKHTFYDAGRFLDSVEADRGAYYGYLKPSKEPTTTSVGLLCRLYLGWSPDVRPLDQGCTALGKLGPAEDNMYFNYYATQVLHHTGGPRWEKWNKKMRDKLIAEQAQRGHESGSWYYPGGHCESGGRLLSTALCVMTLEVYYRYMPLYKPTVLDEGF